MDGLVLEIGDSGKTVKVKTGETFVVRLEENPTTGYRWQPHNFDRAILALKSSSFAPGGDAPGSAGRRSFVFLAEHSGESPVTLWLWREWEGEKSILKRFEATIEVHFQGLNL
jgi:inhibitor of cysteine peptidase